MTKLKLIFSREVWRVWRRNFLYFRRTWVVTLFWIFLEPIINLLAIGIGLGTYIGNMDGIPYLEFYLPGLLCTSVMMVAFFESTYGAYTKLVHQRLSETIVLAPIAFGEVIAAEFLWATSKAILSGVGIVLVASLIGLIEPQSIFMVLISLFPLAMFFASFGLCVTSIAKNYDYFIYFISGIIVPMSLLSGTYFPLHHLPKYFQFIVYVFPLTHLVDAIRSILKGQYHYWMIVQLLLPFAFSALFMKFAQNQLRRRLRK